MPEALARVAECHTGTGLTSADVERLGIPQIPPGVDYMPHSQLERLICYADKFYSKSGDMRRKPMERVRAFVAKFGPEALTRFDALRHEFGEPAED